MRHDLTLATRRRFLAAFVALLALLAWSPGAWADDKPVVVVGEGPVGLITAIKVKMESPNIPVTIYEKRAEDRTGRPQTPMLDQETVDILHDSGFPTDQLTRIQSKTFVMPDGTSKTTTMPAMIHLSSKPKEVGDSVAMMQTGELEAHLRQRATALGIDVKYDTEVRKATNTAEGVKLDIGAPTAKGAIPTPGHPQTARFVVFADGAGGYGAVVAKRETVATMPMVGAITPKPADGKNLVVRSIDKDSGETVSISRLASGQVIAQLPQRLANATPADKDAYLQKQLPLIHLDSSALGQRLVFSGELAHGGTGRGNIFVAGDATGAVPIVTSANLSIHIPLAVKMATAIAKLYPQAPTASAKVLNVEHKEWTAQLHSTREQVTQPVRSRLQDVPKPAPVKPVAPAAPAPVLHAAR